MGRKLSDLANLNFKLDVYTEELFDQITNPSNQYDGIRSAHKSEEEVLMK